MKIRTVSDDAGHDSFDELLFDKQRGAECLYGDDHK